MKTTMGHAPRGTGLCEYKWRTWRQALLLPCALAVAGVGCGAAETVERADQSSGAEARPQAQTLPPCSDICKKKEDCNDGCTEGDPPAATICQASSSGRSMCTEDPFPPPWPVEPPPPPPGGGALRCSLVDCQDNGAWRLIGQQNTQFRETIDPERKPPETELVDFTVNMWAVPRWATRSPGIPHCWPVQCCARITHSHSRGGTAQPWGETYASTQDRCLTF